MNRDLATIATAVSAAAVGGSAAQELDAQCARADFENVLQVMVDKANAPDRWAA